MSKKTNKAVDLSKRRKAFYQKCISKAEKILPNKQKIARIIRKSRKIFERLHDLPKCEGLSKNICDFCDLLADYFDGTYQHLPTATIVALLAGLIYVVAPIDVLADFIPVFGWIDDAAVMAFVVAAEQVDLEEYIEWREQQTSREIDKIERV